MAQIVPAILESSLIATEDKIKLLDGLTDWVELDVCDGKFVPNSSWGNPDDIKLFDDRAKISAHLMVADPALMLTHWQDVVDRVVVHLETAAPFEAMKDRLAVSKNNFGLALKLGTPVSEVEEWVDKISYFQLLAIEHIGYQGQKFDESVLDKIFDLRALAPSATIAVDGGINLESAQKCLVAGADVLVVGSAIWKNSDPVATLNEFKKLVTNH